MTFKTVLFAAAAMAVMSVPALAGGDAAKGEVLAKKCTACHDMKDGKNRVGPGIIGIVGRPIASVADYKYSDDLKAYAAKAGAWDEAKLDSYLENPKKDVPKGKMSFAGMKDAAERADLIAYLATLKP